MARPRLPGELTWPKLLGTSLAAVVAAWLGGRLGLGGTMMGVAIGSVIATFSTAFFTTTIDKTHRVIPTVLVRTDRGTVVETRADHDVTVEDAGETTVLPAVQEPAAPAWGAAGANEPSRWSQIHWKAVAVASLLTMGITIGAISIYESAVGRTWGSNEPGTTLGNTVRGQQRRKNPRRSPPKSRATRRRQATIRVTRRRPRRLRPRLTARRQRFHRRTLPARTSWATNARHRPNHRPRTPACSAERDG